MSELGGITPQPFVPEPFSPDIVNGVGAFGDINTLGGPEYQPPVDTSLLSFEDTYTALGDILRLGIAGVDLELDPTLPGAELPARGDAPHVFATGAEPSYVAPPAAAQAYPGTEGLEMSLHADSDVIPLNANPDAQFNPHWDHEVAFGRFVMNYEAIASQVADMYGASTFGALTKHSERFGDDYEVLKNVVSF